MICQREKERRISPFWSVQFGKRLSQDYKTNKQKDIRTIKEHKEKEKNILSKPQTEKPVKKLQA